MTNGRLDMDILDELRTEFGNDILVDLLRLAKSSAETEISALVEQINQRSVFRMRRIAHSLVGILGQYGATEAANCARQAQAASEEDLVPAALRLVEASRAAIDDLHSYAETVAMAMPKVA